MGLNSNTYYNLVSCEAIMKSEKAKNKKPHMVWFYLY